MKKLGLNAVYDLSATPFFLGGSGYTNCTYQIVQSAEPIASIVLRSTQFGLKGRLLMPWTAPTQRHRNDR
jgi:hypothetical protein